MRSGDIADQAAYTIELATEQAIEAARQSHSSAVYTGRCLYCRAPTEEGRRWCDSDCRDDWERNNRRGETYDDE